MTQIIRDEDTGQYTDTLAPSTGLYDNPYYSLIFIAVMHNGDDFAFLNALHRRFSFKWDRWKPWKSILRPMTFHAFRVKGYKTGTASGHGFTPFEHVCEFPGIDLARIANKHYLDQWHQFHDDDEKTITASTNAYIEQLKEFNAVRHAMHDFCVEEGERLFPSLFTPEEMAWALKVAEGPVPDWSLIIDCGPLAEQLMAAGGLDME